MLCATPLLFVSLLGNNIGYAVVLEAGSLKHSCPDGGKNGGAHHQLILHGPRRRVSVDAVLCADLLDFHCIEPTHPFASRTNGLRYAHATVHVSFAAEIGILLTRRVV